MDHADLLIENGTLVDGSGQKGRPGSVAISGDRLHVLDARENAPVNVDRRIDATGKVVAPGFIDLHSHAGLIILADPRHEPKVRQGVTTEVIGVDGNGFAPFRRAEDLEAFIAFDAGLDGDLAGAAADWRTVAEFLRSEEHTSEL